MLLKCDCKACNGRIEFDAEQTGETTTCPHCGSDTVLTYSRGTSAAAPKNRKQNDLKIVAYVAATLTLLVVLASMFNLESGGVLSALFSMLLFLCALAVAIFF